MGKGLKRERVKEEEVEGNIGFADKIELNEKEKL